MLTRTSFEHLFTWGVILNIGLLLAVVVEIKANEVEFTVSTDVALVGDEVDFICSPPNFDPDNDELTIRFEGDVLLRFKDNTPMYEIGADIYYTVEMVSNQELHLTINVANVSDSGDYFCAISKTTSGTSLTSSSVSLLVQYFPSPWCLAPAIPDVQYSTETGALRMETGINVTLYCQSKGNNVTINWSRSDNKAISEDGATLKSFSFTSSPDDHCVDFKCTSTSSMYPDISYSCVISALTLDIDENPCPTQLPSTEETIIINATTPVQTEKQVSLLLIIGASAAAGVLFLILLVIIISIVMVRYKRKHKHHSLHVSLNLDTPRPSHDVDNMPRFSIDSFDSDIDMSPRQGRKSRTSYENNDLSFYNQVDIGELTQTDSKLSTDSLNSRISYYENNEKGHFVLPPLKEDNKELDSQYPPPYGPIYDKTPDDADGGKYDGAENSVSPGSPGSSSIQPPVYADVKKNKNMTISSVLSDEDNTTPTYAFVNKGSQKNNDESKRLSRLPYAYTEDDEETAENKTKEGNGLQYAGSVNYSEVEFY